MAEKRNRPSDNPEAAPPSRNMGVPSRDVGPSDASLIVAAGTRKERLRERAGKLDIRHRGPRPYAELRAASAFSFLDGASLPEDLVEEAARRGLPAVALVDTNGVYGAPRFYKAANAAGIRPLVGGEVVLDAPRPAYDAAKRRGSRTGREGSTEPARLTLLVENRGGYRNLCRLVTE